MQMIQLYAMELMIEESTDIIVKEIKDGNYGKRNW